MIYKLKSCFCTAILSCLIYCNCLTAQFTSTITELPDRPRIIITTDPELDDLYTFFRAKLPWTKSELYKPHYNLSLIFLQSGAKINLDLDFLWPDLSTHQFPLCALEEGMSRDLDESLSGMAAKALQRILVQEALKENVTQPITIYGYNILLENTSVLINTGFELIWTMLYHRIGHLKLNKRLFWPTCLKVSSFITGLDKY